MRYVVVPLAVVMLAACAPPSIGSYPEAPESPDDDEPASTAKGPGRSSTVDAGAKSGFANPVLTVTITGPGTISSTPGGLTCQGNICTGSFATGVAVTLIPTASAGSTFGGWGGQCTGAGSCAPVMNSAVNITADFQTVDGTWSGKYTHSQQSQGCTFNNAGTMNVKITTSGTTITSAANVDGLEIRQIPGCQKIDSRTGAATSPITSAATSFTGTWNFAIPGVGGTLPLPFTAAVTGKTMTGTWTCAGCTGSFTLTKP
jgi:hypothetical protein